MPGSCQRDNDSHRQDLYVRHELAVAAVEANPDLALAGDYFLEHPYVISERRGPSRVCRFTDLARKENEALILIMTEGIQAIYPGKTPTIKDWHDFVRGVFGGWTSMSVAPRHPVLREPRFDETHIEVGKLTTDAPSETNSTARRAGAPVFLGVSLNYEQGQVLKTWRDKNCKGVSHPFVELHRGLTVAPEWFPAFSRTDKLSLFLRSTMCY